MSLSVRLERYQFYLPLYSLILGERSCFSPCCLSPESYSACYTAAYCQYMAKQTGDNINHNAHFYGAIYGLIFPMLLEPSLLHLFLSQLTFKG